MIAEDQIVDVVTDRFPLLLIKGWAWLNRADPLVFELKRDKAIVTAERQVDLVDLVGCVFVMLSGPIHELV